MAEGENTSISHRLSSPVIASHRWDRERWFGIKSRDSNTGCAVMFSVGRFRNLF
jgi:hypothetical protein